jgi:hypothetical protein
MSLLRASALATPNTTTVKDVEIVQTGIEYPLSTGPATFTTEDLSDLVESQGDPAIKAPRLKLGHTADIGLMEDGQPAIGTLGNLRLEQDGHLVVGDYVGIPTWLAEVLPSAYPSRSIEAVWGVETNTGHTWRLVLTDLALLGVVWPGVGTLDDIQALYSEQGPDNVQVLTTKEEVDAMARPARGKVRAQVDAEDIRRQYYNQLASDQFWWWIRSMFVDPNELIVEDEDTGDLYRVPFESKGDTVTFSDPVAVKVVYKDKPANQQPDKQEAAWEVPVPPLGHRLAVFANRAESRPGQEGSDVGVTTDVDPIALRNSLGLAEDASDEEVRTALASAGIITPPGQSTGGDDNGRAPAAEQPGTSATVEHTPGGPDNTAPAGPTDPAVAQPESGSPASETGAGAVEPPVTASSTVTVDRATWEETRRQAAEGSQAFARQAGEDRERVLNAAIEEGRIPPSRRAHWSGLMERDPEGTRTLLTAAEDKGGLAKGLVPVQARGAENPLESTNIEAYPAEWLPEIKRGG